MKCYQFIYLIYVNNRYFLLHNCGYTREITTLEINNIKDPCVVLYDNYESCKLPPYTIFTKAIYQTISRGEFYIMKDIVLIVYSTFCKIINHSTESFIPITCELGKYFNSSLQLLNSDFSVIICINLLRFFWNTAFVIIIFLLYIR